jgi:hypothetical protein
MPEEGRYLQTDPIGLAGGVNTYGYVGANPITRVDPDGLDDLHMTLLYGGVTNSYPDRRAPDYVGFDLSFGYARIGYVLTRNGTIFSGGGLGTNPVAPLSAAGMFGFSIYSGKLDSCPTDGAVVDAFIAGKATTVGGNLGLFGLGMSRTWNSAGAATNAGIGTPGYTYEKTEYGQVGSTGVSW